MNTFAIFLNQHNTPCVMVGGGQVAYRKVTAIIQAGLPLKIIAPNLCDELQDLVQRKGIDHQAKAYHADDISDAKLVFAATNQTNVNQQIALHAKAINAWVNIADDPANSSFIMPSVVERPPITIAVSTGGASPVLARMLRLRLETLIPNSCGRLAQITEQYREKVKQVFARQVDRKRFWENNLKGTFAELVYAGQDKMAINMLEQQLSVGKLGSDLGEVFLVGSGPGDPDLLTVKAVRLMQLADVVVYDRLVSNTILSMANQSAEYIYVGKAKSNHAVPQEEINDLLVRFAKKGKKVLRLKGGDPFIFGRGGEEIETLSQHQVPFQVVPAVTAASGCSAYAGIPLTHRDYAQSVTFATGHLKDGSIDLDFEKLAQSHHTIVFYMGLTGISVISQQLQLHGLPADTPAALVEQGTTRNQRVHIGTLDTLPQLVKEREVRAPTLTIIGEVVSLHDTLSWYEPEKHVQETEFSSSHKHD